MLPPSGSAWRRTWKTARGAPARLADSGGRYGRFASSIWRLDGARAAAIAARVWATAGETVAAGPMLEGGNVTILPDAPIPQPPMSRHSAATAPTVPSLTLVAIRTGARRAGGSGDDRPSGHPSGR